MKTCSDMNKNIELTDEQVKMLDDLKDRPIVFDDENPGLTKAELKQFRRVHTSQNVNLNLIHGNR